MSKVWKASEQKKKAPLKIVLVITEIFMKMSMDAMPTAPSRNRYIITTLCMSSKYPDAIPVADLGN